MTTFVTYLTAALILVAIVTGLLIGVERRPLREALWSSLKLPGIPTVAAGAILTLFPGEGTAKVAQAVLIVAVVATLVLTVRTAVAKRANRR